ncbi:cyclic AMP-dependent transcription factor ATF-4 isoform X1 [Syngnathus acus]|uniref:cyclic AMP-dependent transcription factor ATF-4 isoform X1 n=1 Tax=Syngnathus acus TaxID=161584 RepID=UPI0018863113|nr:cyclic AMP-dependent transcription factor ATF-4 isoform X1 [Syngnathus acus]
MMLALEAVEALCSGPSFLMADHMGPLLDQDDEEALSPSSSLGGEVPGSPPLSLSLSPYHTLLSPPSPSFLEDKAGSDVTSLPWLAAGDLLHAHVGAEHAQDDAFAGMDWMSEKIDLSDLDLESLIGSCSSDEPPASPEDLMASLRSHVDLDLEPFRVAPGPESDGQPELPAVPAEVVMESEPAAVPAEVVMESEPAAVPAEVVMKSEPCSPGPPRSPGFSESDAKSPLPQEVFIKTASPPSSDCDSDSGIESSAGSPRAKPYDRSEPPSGSSSPAPKAKVKSASGAPKVVEKKLKKMEQNKTAATRYRQKKRVEQEQLSVEREDLESRNRELAERADAISREIQYLKDLMEEVRKHHRGKTSAATK